MFVDTDNGKVFYEEQGAGVPLLMLHGATLDADSLVPLASRLSDRFRCIVMDRPGYERSHEVSTDMTIDLLVSATRAVHRACTDEPVWLFGHSAGGNFALAYAARYPAAVKGLILMEPALYAIFADDEVPAEVTSIRNDVLPRLRKGDIEGGLEVFRDLIDANVPENWEQMARLPIFGHDNVEVFRHEAHLLLDWCPSTSEFTSMSKPTLVIEGALTGPLLRGTASALVSRLLDGKLVTLADCDHGAPVLEPEAVAKEISDFVHSS